MSNLFKVPKKQWMRWSPKAKEVFNRLYPFALSNQRLMIHPKQVVNKPVYWKTCAWNAAWIAADAVDNALPTIILNTDGTQTEVA